MSGCLKGFMALVKNNHGDINWTHCVIHREALAARAMSDDLKSTMQDCIQLCTFIKTRPKHTRLFQEFCKDQDKTYKFLLLSAETRWLYRGKQFRRLFEVKDVLTDFLKSSDDVNVQKARLYAEKLSSTDFLLKMAYLSDLFEHLNNLNTYLQGSNMNKFLAHSRIEFMKSSFKVFIRDIKSSKYTKFPKLNEIVQTEKCKIKEIESQYSILDIFI